MEKDTCKLRLGPYIMHFTGYQPERAEGREFCEDIPGTGRTIIVLDDVDHALRDTPLGIRIVREGADSRAEGGAIVELAPRIYPAGSVSLEHDFTESGRYVGIVTGGARGEHVSRFPFSVGGTTGWSRHVGVIFTIAAAGVALFMAPRWIKGSRRRATH